ncbi:MAG: CapA family protein [Actinomycetes bacterium]
MRNSEARRRRVGAIVVLLTVAIGAAACSGTTDQQVAVTSAPTSVASSTSSTATTSTTVARNSLGNGETVTLAFAGDANFEGLDGALAANPTGLLRAITPLLSDADVTVVNFEAALGTRGVRQPKAFNFHAPPSALDALRAAGVDAVSMANNHGMDFGPEGLADSLAIEQAEKFPVIGVGADDAEAYAPYEVEVRGQRIGVIAANDVFDDPLRAAWTAGPGKPGIASAEEAHQERLADEVRRLRQRSDTVAVILHYGLEKQTCPNERQKALAKLLLDAGADIVVGGHPHRVQGAGFLGDKAVAYSMGNFIFPGRSAGGAETGVLKITATGHRIDAVEWRPATIRGVIPYPAAPGPGLAHMAQLRSCAGLTERPSTGG